jgi:predicted house-cleaning noncanonical NTP pyrophosphatase (MazG superfamily)
MKRRAFLQNKLWRDLAVDMLEEQGSIIHWRRLDDEEFGLELRKKLVEESHEVATADSLDALQAEMADVLEVIESLCSAHGWTLTDIQQQQNQKKCARGSFAGRRYVTIAEHLEGSFGERYCLADIQKYPEVIKTDH